MIDATEIGTSQEDTEMLAILDQCVPGARIRINAPHVDGTPWHVLAIVDGDHIVIKWWRRHKQRWEYEVKWVYELWLFQQNGALEIEAP